MVLTGWETPQDRVLKQCPRAASLSVLLDGATPDFASKLNRFVDALLNVEPDIISDLALGCRLRNFALSMAAAVLRNFEVRLARFGPHLVVIDCAIRAAIRAGLADSSPGAAEKVLIELGNRVRVQFEKDNLKLTMLPGGAGGLESVVAGLMTLSANLTSLGAIKIINLRYLKFHVIFS